MTIEVWLAAAIGVVLTWVGVRTWRRRHRRQVSLVPPPDETRSRELLRLAATDYSKSARRRNGGT